MTENPEAGERLAVEAAERAYLKKHGFPGDRRKHRLPQQVWERQSATAQAIMRSDRFEII